MRKYVAIRERIAGARQALRKIIKEVNSKEVDEILDNLSFEHRLLKIYSNLKSDLGDISVDKVVEILKKRAEKVDEDSRRTPEIELSALDSHDFLDGKIKKTKKTIMVLEEKLTLLNLST